MPEDCRNVTFNDMKSAVSASTVKKARILLVFVVVLSRYFHNQRNLGTKTIKEDSVAAKLYQGSNEMGPQNGSIDRRKMEDFCLFRQTEVRS